MRTLFRSSIAAQVALILALTATVLLTIGGWLFYKRTYDDAWLNFERQMSKTASALASAVAEPLMRNDESRIKDVVDNIMQDEQIYTIMLIHEGGSRSFSRDPEKTAEENKSTFKSPPELSNIARPIHYEGREVGTVRLYMSTAELKAFLRRWVLVRALSILLFDILLIIVIYSILWVKVFYPLWRLKQYALNINLQAPEDTRSVDWPDAFEFRVVIQAMDAMIKRMRNQMKEISENNESFNRMCRKFPIPIGISNPSTQEITFLNEQFIESFGYEPADMPTMEDFARLAFPDPGKRREFESMIVERWQQAVQEDKPLYPFEQTIRCKNGEDRVVEISGVISNQNFRLTLLNDITTRYQAEKAVREQQARLRDLTAHVQDVREQERKRIAQELHDELGQILTVARIDLSNLITDAQTPVTEAFRKKITDLTKTIDEASDTARRISENLRPGMLDLLGLGPALELHVNRFISSTHIEVELNLDEEEALNINDRVATTAFRVVQEALTNVARYAKASKVDIHVVNLGKELLIVIQDNGIGFESKALGDKPGFGLLGMRERANMLGGHISIESAIGKGVRIEASLPIDNAAADTARLSMRAGEQ